MKDSINSKEHMEENIVSMLENMMREQDESYLFLSEDESASFIDEPLRHKEEKLNTAKQMENMMSKFRIAPKVSEGNNNYNYGHDFQLRGVNRKFHTQGPITPNKLENGNFFQKLQGFQNFDQQNCINNIKGYMRRGNKELTMNSQQSTCYSNIPFSNYSQSFNQPEINLHQNHHEDSRTEELFCNPTTKNSNPTPHNPTPTNPNLMNRGYPSSGNHINSVHSMNMTHSINNMNIMNIGNSDSFINTSNVNMNNSYTNPNIYGELQSQMQIPMQMQNETSQGKIKTSSNYKQKRGKQNNVSHNVRNKNGINNINNVNNMNNINLMNNLSSSNMNTPIFYNNNNIINFGPDSINNQNLNFNFNMNDLGQNINILNNLNQNNQNIKNNPYNNNYVNVSKINSLNNMNTSNLSNINSNSNNESIFTELEKMLTVIDKIDEYIFLYLKGKFVFIIKTQSGSRIFQKYLKNTSQEIIHKIFFEIFEQLNELLTDNYANYFCHKLFGYLNKEDRFAFLKRIQPSMLVMSSSKIGTYPLQGIIDQVNSHSERSIFIETFKDFILDMCKDIFATHVVEKMITSFPEQSIKFIYEVILENFLFLANDSSGLCVVKKLIIHCTNKEMLEEIKAKIEGNVVTLIQNPYGNYAVQIALDYWTEEDTLLIIKKLANKYINLSMQKYSSNVVEKCLEKSEEFALKTFVDEVIYMNRIADLMKNNYGNFVVQKALKLATGVTKKNLMSTIIKNIEKIGDKKLIAKWRSILSSNMARSTSSCANNKNEYFEEEDYIVNQNDF